MTKYKIPLLEVEDVEFEDADEEIAIEQAREVVMFIANMSAEIIKSICIYAEENNYDPNDLLDCTIDTLDLFASQVDLDYYEIDEDGEGFFEVPEGNGMLN